VGNLARCHGAALKRGEIWWADLGTYRPREQTGRRPVVIWQSDTLTRMLQSVLVVPLTRIWNASATESRGGPLACVEVISAVPARFARR
jgi:mRNA-degrading endonuclease toxin of MazEF toxin-antitoxin module